MLWHALLQLALGARLRYLAPGVISGDPDLREEVLVADVVEDQVCLFRRPAGLSLSDIDEDRDAIVHAADQEQIGIIAHAALDGVLPGGESFIPGDKFERDAGDDPW